MATILIVEDDRRMQLLLSRTMPETDQVLLAVSGDECVLLVREHQPDVVVLDINLPGLNGIEVLQQMRAHGLLTGTKVIVVTARESEADQKLARALGAVEYFVKPFSPKALLQAIEKAVA